jgi:hypothetical protein
VGVGVERSGEGGRRRWCEFNALILARGGGDNGGVATSIGGEEAPGRGKGGDGTSWANTNFTGLKNKENPYDRFNCYKWTVKI